MLDWILRGSLAAAVFFVSALIASSVWSHPLNCVDREWGINSLKEKHNENRAGYAIDENGKGFIELFVSPSGTWTITVHPAGTNKFCRITSGNNWVFEMKKLPIPGDDS